MLTPEQARDLVDWAGSQRGAAAAIGVVHSTIQRWLDPEVAERHRERNRTLHRERYADPERRERRRRSLRAVNRRRRVRLKDAGTCTRCGKEPLTTEAYCWNCLNQIEEARTLAIAI